MASWVTSFTIETRWTRWPLTRRSVALRTCERLRVTSRAFYSDCSGELRSPFLEGNGPIPRALARHQPVVAVEQHIGSQVRRVGFEDYREISGNRRVTETEVRRMQYQQAAR